MKSYFLTEEHEVLKGMVKEFVQNEVVPVTKELDEKHEFPYELMKRCGELGFTGIPIPEKWGGAGSDAISMCIVIEEISKVNASLGLTLDAHTSLGCTPIAFAGTDAQKEKYLIDIASGKKIAAFGLTEPNAGSDAGGTQTTARLDGDHFVINGAKCWITNIGAADTYTITARTDPDSKGPKGISAIIVEKGTPGFTIGKPEKKMGFNSCMSGDLYFNECRVPKENLLGELHQGFKTFMVGLDEGRIAIGAIAVGMAQAALDLAAKYSKERVQFGKPISAFQGVSFKLAEMQAAIDYNRTYMYRVAKMRDSGMRYSTEAAILKFMSSEMALDVIDKSLQIQGGIGYHGDSEVSRMYRDAKLLTIGEGTSEICRVVVGNAVLAKY